MKSNTFTITVSWPSTYADGLPLEAWQGGFVVGPGITSASSYCPSSAGTACPVGNQTVFIAGGSAMVGLFKKHLQLPFPSGRWLLFLWFWGKCRAQITIRNPLDAVTKSAMANLYRWEWQDVEVPGGQQVYIGPDGALSFTQAHSASYPPGSQFGGFGASGGEFVFSGSNGTGWIACPLAATDFSPPLNYISKIYANVSSHPTRYPNGGPIFVCYDVVLLLDAYTGGFGAWQYAWNGGGDKIMEYSWHLVRIHISSCTSRSMLLQKNWTPTISYVEVVCLAVRLGHSLIFTLRLRHYPLCIPSTFFPFIPTCISWNRNTLLPT